MNTSLLRRFIVEYAEDDVVINDEGEPILDDKGEVQVGKFQRLLMEDEDVWVALVEDEGELSWASTNAKPSVVDPLSPLHLQAGAARWRPWIMPLRRWTRCVVVSTPSIEPQLSRALRLTRTCFPPPLFFAPQKGAIRLTSTQNNMVESSPRGDVFDTPFYDLLSSCFPLRSRRTADAQARKEIIID